MNPYIPKSNPRFVIIDYRANDDIIKFLKKRNIIPIKTIKCLELQEPVNGHPDMVLHLINERTLLVAPNVYDYYKEIFKNKGIKVIKGGKTLCRNYPDDIAYNVSRIGRYAVHNTKHTDYVLKYYLEKSDIEFVHVNQGYTKCSMTSVDCQSAITSDIGIYNKLKSYHINCLYISPEFVRLEGYNHGFIGGCTGLLNSRIFLLTGTIPNGDIVNKLRRFINALGYEYVEASSDIIKDLGTIVPII